MAMEQLEVVHAAGVRKSGLLLGESQGISKEGYWWTEGTGGRPVLPYR